MKPVTACFIDVFINNFKNQPQGGFQLMLKLSAHLNVLKIYLEVSLQVFFQSQSRRKFLVYSCKNSIHLSTRIGSRILSK